VRLFKLHAARYTYASLALASRKSVRGTADQLGHASPMLTLKTYAHAMKEEEADLSFADFGSPGRPYATPAFDARVASPVFCTACSTPGRVPVNN